MNRQKGVINEFLSDDKEKIDTSSDAIKVHVGKSKAM